MVALRFIEGVSSYRFRVTGRVLDGARIRFTRRSPGSQWMCEEVGREAADCYGASAIKPNSARIELAP